MADLTMDRGDTETVVFTMAGDDTFAAGDTVWFTAKHKTRDADADAVIAKHSGAGGGVTFTAGEATATATILPADTSDLDATAVLVYDWQLRTQAGAVHTLERGTLTVRADVTISATPPV